MRKVLLLTVMCLALLGSAIAQHSVSGTVVSGADGQGMPGVTVSEKGTTQGTLTDNDGKFSIKVTSEKSILVFSFVGMSSVEQAVNGRTTLSIKMISSEIGLGEVVVTALGISRESKKIGFSTAQVAGAELAMTQQINPVNALQGKIAGVQIDQGAAGPFGSSRILIRGNSTLGINNQPIFVVDGVIVENDAVLGGRDFGNDLKNLNSEDFENVSILKGSAAAALYGSRAINGVILITTKKGKKSNGIGVDLNQSYTSYNAYRGPDFQNEYGGGSVGAYFTDTRDPNYTSAQDHETKVFPIDPVTHQPYIDQARGREGENWGPKFANQQVTNYDGTPTTYKAVPNNFLDAFEKAMLSTTNVSLQGANDRTTFRFSLTDESQKGMMPQNKLQKNGFNLRVTHELTKWLSADISVDYTTVDNKNPYSLGGGNIGNLFSWTLPRNYDTKYWQQKSKYTSILGGTPDVNNPNEPNKAPQSNFWFSMFEDKAEQKDNSIRGRFALTAKLNKWSNLTVEGNVNNIYGKYEGKSLGQGLAFYGGGYSTTESRRESNFLKWMLNFNDISITDDLKFSGFVGGEAQNIVRSYVSGSTNGGLLIPGNYFIGNSINPPSVSSGINYNKKLNSLYASADFEYKNQLFLNTTVRGDWSSALTYANGTGNNFYSYPAASLSWIFTETFKNLPSAISFGKLRTNLASLGKDTDPYIINPGYNFTGNANGEIGTPSTAGFSSSSTLVPNLKPERKIAKEIGAEMRFLKNRIGFEVSLYQDNTYNQIINVPTPGESGVSGIKVNAGDIQNKGIEITLDGSPIKTRDFQWNSRITYSSNKNMINSLYGDIKEFELGGPGGNGTGAPGYEVDSWAIVGQAYGVIRSTTAAERFENKSNKADPRNGMAVLSWREGARTAFPHRSGVWKTLGNTTAKFRGGFSNDFTYKNWSLNVLIDAKVGGDMVIASYRWGTHTGALANTLVGRDAQHGGISWTTKYNENGNIGIKYDDGLLPEGVFAPGQHITQADNSSVDVGGMTFKEAYAAGYVEPSHAPEFYYRYGSSSTGVSDYWVKESTWVSLRNVSLSYTLPKNLISKLKMNSVVVSLVGRDLCYLYNSLPLHFNPASLNSTSTAAVGENGFMPMMRSLGGSIRVSF